MMNEFLVAITGTVSLFGAGWVGWFFRRRSERAEAKGKEIDNEVKLSEYYKVMLDDLNARYEKKFAEYVEMQDRKFSELAAMHESKEKLLHDEITLLHRKNKMLTTENNSYRRRIKELEK